MKKQTIIKGITGLATGLILGIVTLIGLAMPIMAQTFENNYVIIRNLVKITTESFRNLEGELSTITVHWISQDSEIVVRNASADPNVFTYFDFAIIRDENSGMLTFGAKGGQTGYNLLSDGLLGYSFEGSLGWLSPGEGFAFIEGDLLIGVVDTTPETPTQVTPLTPFGTIAGNVLNTDIRVFINNQEIMGYNIDGYTFVVAEDLTAFGLAVIWDGLARTLSITRGTNTTQPQTVPVNLQPVGSVAFPFFYTDIVAYINGQAVKSFNVDGQTIVRVSDIAVFGSYQWLPAERELRVTY